MALLFSLASTATKSQHRLHTFVGSGRIVCHNERSRTEWTKFSFTIWGLIRPRIDLTGYQPSNSVSLSLREQDLTS